MLYRFADAESLAAWEASPQREWWLEAAQGGLEETRRERRTGIEGWFDEPAVGRVAQRGARRRRRGGSRWSSIFLVFFPLSLVANSSRPHAVADWPLLPLRVLLTMLVMTPLMTYVFLPWITRRMSWWLHR